MKAHYVRIIVEGFFERNVVKCHIHAFENTVVGWKNNEWSMPGNEFFSTLRHL